MTLVGASVAAASSAYSYLAASVPPAAELANVRVDQSTKVYDRNGRLLYEIFDQNSGRRTLIPPEDIPELVRQATIATEDPSFYANPGVDWMGIARAIYYNTQTDRSVGGSTITQQLVKNTLLTSEVSLDRKIREAILSLEVTRRYSKDEILALYLNTNNYGNLTYGTEAAARFYFKKNARDLDLAEVALLAGLPQAPSVYDPCQNPDAALDRQRIVLTLMQRQGYIDASQGTAAQAEMRDRLHSNDFAQNCTATVGTVAPHFVEYVRKTLEEQFGPQAVYRGGLRVYTTLDLDVQKIAEDEARQQIAQLKDKHVTNAAVVVLNPQTGEIYAMVGSVNFFDKSIDGQVNMATSPRQPGSSIKPLTYLTALKKGWTLATPILDVRTKFNNGTEPPYIPVNYDMKYHGIVNIRTALANSLNIPAVKTLFFVGVPQLMDTAQTFGISTLRDPNRYGLALTLGGGEVKLIEHAGAFAVLANQGNRVQPTPFLKIVDGDGHTLVDNTSNRPTGTQVVDPRYAYLITSVLSDNKARAPEFGLNSPLKLSRPAAAKTGTTNDFRDNWTMGYTPELVVGVWVGNADNTQMKNSTGITGAAPIWHNVMERIYKEIVPFKNIPPHEFKVPGGLVQVEVCDESGLLPNPRCPNNHRHKEIFLAEHAPTAFDKFWSGEWGGTCWPGPSKEPEPPKDDTPEKKAKRVPGPLYDEIVKQAQKRGVPQSLAGIGRCTYRDNPSPAPNPTPPDVQAVSGAAQPNTVQ